MAPFQSAVEGVLTVMLLTIVTVATASGAQDNAPAPAGPGGASSRVWKVENPLFQELLSDQPMGHSAGGAILWAHDWGQTAFGLQYGAVRTMEQDLRRWKAYNLHPLEHGGKVKDPPLLGNLRRYKEAGMRPAYYPFQYFMPEGAEDIPVDDRNGYVFILDPVARERFLKGLKADMEEFGDSIFSCQMLDEALSVMLYQAVHFRRKFGETREYPFIEECQTEVKERFGFGKYGLPDEFMEEAPFKWIAARRWVLHKALELARDARVIVKEHAPHVLFVSYDPPSQVQPGRYSLWNGIFDVVIHQVSEGAAPSADFSRFGYITKHLVDLSGAEVWPVPHIHNQQFDPPPNFTPEETIDLLSQLLRNGARGLVVYMPDQPGLTKTRKYCFYSDLLGAPERYFTEVETVNLIASMNRLKFPTPDFGLFYSNDANMARRGWSWNSDASNGWAYMLLGPRMGGWFCFVDDDQLEKQTVDLAQYRSLFLPYAEYERKAAVEALVRYVADGGTLICGDPVVFRAFDDGTSAEAFRERLFGVSSAGDKPFSPKVMTITDGTSVFGGFTGSLPLGKTSAQRVKAVAGAHVIASFEDGTPAVILNVLGKGRAVYFAFQPFTEAVSRDPGWLDLFRKMSTAIGIKLEQDIWRFKIPLSKYSRLTPPIPAGTCLTGNYLLWTQSAPYSVRNLDTGGCYRLVPAPDGIADVADSPDFATGKLTNRLCAPKAGNYEKGFSKLSDWVVKWAGPGDIEILFDFQRPYSVNRVALFYQGQIRGATVSVRQKEDTPWHHVAEDTAAVETSGVDMKEFTFAPTSGRWVRVILRGGGKGKPLTLSEVEVWSNEELAPRDLRPVVD